ncbi:MAG: DNA repair protein RadC [Dehalococcoidales bacterium]|nr:DNA repair protein RadC [Dehalococcoidales bacterium]
MQNNQLNEDDQGHRRRLRERFLKSGLDGFQDYEIIELLLSLGIPRRNLKHQAKEIIRRFKTLRGVMEASTEELQKVKGIGPHGVFGFKFVHAVASEYLKEKVLESPVFNTSREVFDYFYHSMRDMKKEIMKVVYLNSQNRIIEIQDVSRGTVDSSYIYPREVIEGAIKYHAVSLILVHNHPSGNPQPSQNDRDLTRNMVYLGTLMQIKLLDHIIIGDNRYFSFAAEGFIEKCELELLNLRKN